MRSTTQSDATVHCVGGGGGGGVVGLHTNWQLPVTHASAAHEPFAHCGQAPTDGQSASLVHVSAPGEPGLEFPDGHVRPHWPLTQSVWAQLPSAQS